MEELSYTLVILFGVVLVCIIYVNSQTNNNSELEKNLNKFDETHRKVPGNKKD
ncbi:MAG: hypothetical protein GOVbin1629_74 [Prokaryotic dsDNA virus sp.]|nr:MAG: hypothetical protein GOVbin1629_74 [Prokaryotic dsDNA virus sp.]